MTSYSRLKHLWMLLLVVAAIAVQGALAQGDVTCKNGGVANGNIVNPCNCPSFWGGDDCGENQCINGGYSVNNRCVCPSGYLGLHCDAVSGINPPSGLFASKTSFNLVYINMFSDYWGGLAFQQFNKSITDHVTSSGISYASYNLLTTTQVPGIGDDVNDMSCGFKEVYNFIGTNGATMVEFLAALPKVKSPVLYSCYTVPLYGQIIQFIKINQMSDSAITIFTQHPPMADPQSRDALIYLAQAFKIRINVIWSDDQTFVRCDPADKQVLELKEIARSTGGLFVAQAHDANPSSTALLDVVISSHFAYQLVSMTSSESTCDTSIQFNADPTVRTFNIITDGVDQFTTNTGCSGLQVASNVSNGYGVIAYKYTGALASCTIKITGSGSCSAKVFTSDASLYGYRFYSSFVEYPKLDSANVQPDKGNSLYLTLHTEFSGPGTPVFSVDSLSIIRNSGVIQSLMPVVREDLVTFETISNITFNCGISMLSRQNMGWIDIRLRTTVGGQNQFIKRCIEYKCYDKSANFVATTTPMGIATTTPMGTTGVVTTAGVATTIQVVDTTTNPVMTTAELQTTVAPKTYPLPMLAIGYADSLDSAQYAAFVVASLQQTVVDQFGSFGEILFDSSLKQPIVFNTQNTSSDFNSAVYNNYKPDGAPRTADVNPQAIEALLNMSSAAGQNAVLSLVLDRLPGSSSQTYTADKFYGITNNNQRALLFMDAAAFTADVTTWARSSAPLVTAAALSGGHFVVSDQKTNFGQLITLLYNKGPGQNLLFWKNIQANPQPSRRQGTIDISSFAAVVNITITATHSVTTTGDLSRVATASVRFVSNDNGTVDTTVSLPKWASSNNFYSATVSLPPGKYDVMTTTINSGDAFHLRLWNARTSTDVQVKYRDLKDVELVNGPNDFDGAALRVLLQNGQTNNIGLTISDCTGTKIPLYDVSQAVQNVLDKESAFVPFFCTSTAKTNCLTDNSNIYQVQMTSSLSSGGGWSGAKSFVCQSSTLPNAAGCDQFDSNGNYLCGGAAVPYKRGRSGQLIDCSDNGNLYYDPSAMTDPQFTPPTAPYRCKCTGASKGPSCEQGDCGGKNLAAGSTDNQYRTLTVVIGGDNVNELGMVVSDAAKVLLPLRSDSIWQYHLMIYCYIGQVIPLYIGGDYDAFNTTFYSKMPACSDSTATPNFDLVAVHRAATRAVGREQRGMIIFYNELNDAISVNVEMFMEAAQQYRQELFIYSVVDEADFNTTTSLGKVDVLSAAFATGGTVIYDEKLYLNPALIFSTKLFSDLIGNSTSLNMHQYQLTVPATQTLTLQVEAANSYVIIGSNTSLNLQVNGDFCKITGGSAGTRTGICPLKQGVNTIVMRTATYWISVYALDGMSPSGKLIAQRSSDDSTTAVAVTYTVSGPTLAISVPNGWSVVDNKDPAGRMAKRSGCTFDTTTYTIFKSIPVGANTMQLDFKNDATSVVVTKVFPIAASANIVCVNGGVKSPSVGTCTCPTFSFGGPDCGLLNCGDGVPSTWGDACNCRDVTGGGRVCATPPR